jgi:hypothetical protein
MLDELSMSAGSFGEAERLDAITQNLLASGKFWKMFMTSSMKSCSGMAINSAALIMVGSFFSEGKKGRDGRRGLWGYS